MVTKKTTEMIIRLQEIPNLTRNATTVEREATRLLIFWRIKEKRKTMMLKTSLWDPNYVEKYNKITTKEILKNGW